MNEDNETKIITVEDLDSASAKFLELERRGSFYDMALGLVRAGYELEGCILFLATWNFASFRYAAKDFNIAGLRDLLNVELRDDFATLAGVTIQDVDLSHHGALVESIFNRLAAMKEVLFTGATKVMHLKCPELFVIWDDYIRGGKPKKMYLSLPCVASGKWLPRNYEKSGKGYVSFLSDIQARCRELRYSSASKTLAKAIDEFNYVNVTLPMQKMEAERREERARVQ